MKKLLFTFSVFLSLLISCDSQSGITQDQIKEKIYSNNFKFVVTNYDSRKTFNAPAGTGRILSTNQPITALEDVGIIITHDKLTVNLPLDENTSRLKKTSLQLTSLDFTVARKDLENGNILLNFLLNDHTDINLIKMEVAKNKRIDASIEGPQQPPLLYVGELRMNNL